MENNKLGGGRRRVNSFSESVKKNLIFFLLYENNDGGKDTHLPQPVFFPHKDTSKDVRMIQHREQFVAEQNWVCPLSPILQIRRVPCHRRFSFPADRPVLTNCPWVSTAALKRSIRTLSLFHDPLFYL